MVILANMERLPVNAVILSSIEIQLYTEVAGLSGYNWKFFQIFFTVAVWLYPEVLPVTPKKDMQWQ